MKYVKLNENRDDFASAIFNDKPEQLKQVSKDQEEKYGWFPVNEQIPSSPDRELYIPRFGSWKLENSEVIVNYVNELIDIEQRKQILTNRVDNLKIEKLNQPITIDGVIYDFDEVSVKRISGAVLSALVEEGFKTPWITYNNEQINLDSAKIKKIGLIFATNEQSIVLYSRKLKNDILSSEEPEKIDILSEWPSSEYTTE